MSKLLCSIAISLLLLMSATATAQRNNKGDSTDIRIATIKQDPGEIAGSHKNRDLEVFRLAGLGNQYVVCFYMTIADTVRAFKVYKWDTEMMRRARYKWVDDTTAAIRMYNPATGRHSELKVAGNMHNGNKSTSIHIDE